MIDQAQLRPEEKALIEKPAEPLLEPPTETLVEPPTEQPAPVEWNEQDMPEDDV